MREVRSLPRGATEMVIYVGDSGDVVNRLITTHCSGNVEGSALRLRVARAKGWGITRARRPSGSPRVRIDLPDPRTGEAEVSHYIRSGEWQYVLCDSYEEAHDFQWFTIEQLRPLLNSELRPWQQQNAQRYQALLGQLLSAHPLRCTELRGRSTGPGVYALHHQQTP